MHRPHWKAGPGRCSSDPHNASGDGLTVEAHFSEASPDRVKVEADPGEARLFGGSVVDRCPRSLDG